MRPELISAVEHLVPEMERLYRSFHAAPELSMAEHGTANAISGILDDWGMQSFRSAGTGVGVILRNGVGPVVAYRADIDGLPIAEETGLSFASRARGTLPDGTEVPVMHGCGHDCHIVIALGLARALDEMRELWAGTVVVLFQPGEETGEGAAAMLADGLWQTAPVPEAIYGQHVWPLPLGQIAVPIGPAMAMADSLQVTVHGTQAHGSKPEDSIDPIVLGAFMVTRLQTIVSRELAGTDAAVITVGTFHSGLKDNIIPAKAVFSVNVRTFEEGIRARVLDSIERIINAEAAASGAPRPQIERMYAFPPCVNDKHLATKFLVDVRQLPGSEANPCAPVMGSEDFGRLGDAIGVPYVFWFVGCYSSNPRGQDGIRPGNHSPSFAPHSIPELLRLGIGAGLVALMGHIGRTQ
jgi:hippurate hydrolase